MFSFIRLGQYYVQKIYPLKQYIESDPINLESTYVSTNHRKIEISQYIDDAFRFKPEDAQRISREIGGRVVEYREVGK